VLSGTWLTPAQAQQAGSPQPILVIGQRSLFGVPPERTLTEEDISAYGIGTVGELLDEVARENGESPNEPVILINGRPVASLDDIEEYPPEVVSQVEVLPRGSATRVGGSANRRVFNIVLKRKAAAKVGRAALRGATDGGSTSRRGDLTLSHVTASQRLNASLRLRDEDSLLESERDIIQPAGSPPELGRFRTLLPSIDAYQLSLSAADRLAPWLTGTLTGKLANSHRRSLLGLSETDDPLRQRSRTLAGDLDLTLNAELGSWLITLLGTYDYDRRRTRTDQPTASSQTKARTTTANADLSATGPIVDLPAGPLRLTFGVGLGRDSIIGHHRLGDEDRRDRFVQLSRSVTGGIEIPIASRTGHVLSGIGELTTTAQINRSHVSHFGSFTNQTYALAWQPAEWLRLFGSVTMGRTPPAVGFIADPLLITPSVRYLDPLRNETVDVTQISGGNPKLEIQRASHRRLSANIKPFRALPLQLTAEYTAVRNRDIVTALPPASDLIFVAFPDRFIRDSSGVLTEVDVRPVQFARETLEQLRYSLHLNLPLGGSHTSMSTSAKGSNEDADSGRETSAPTEASPGQPRVQLNLSHVVLLKRELLIREGIEPIDLLSENAIGLGGVGRPRNLVDFSLGYAELGLGLRFTGQYRSVSFLRLTGDGKTNVLRFAPLTTFNLRGWLEPGRFAPEAKWLNEWRLTLSVLNLTNKRQRVTDSAGLTPIAYQRAYRDPVGRSIEVELRKAF
jgi:hypothetical protein